MATEERELGQAFQAFQELQNKFMKSTAQKNSVRADFASAVSLMFVNSMCSSADETSFRKAERLITYHRVIEA